MSHSLILPRHVGEARQRQRAVLRDGELKEAAPYVEGRLDYPDEWFDAEKARIRARIGWLLDRFDMKLNGVLVALFMRPDTTAGGIILTDETLKEDIYQGTTALVLKLGPRCFEDSEALTWTDSDRFKPDDWVLIRRSSAGGFRTRLNGVDCIHFENERGIKAVIPRPDLVF